MHSDSISYFSLSTKERTHTESVSTVRTHGIGQKFASRGDGNASTIAQFVQTTLLSQIPFPITAIGRTTGHSTQQVRVDGNDFLNSTTGNVRTHGRTRINRYYDPSLEFEGERCRAFGKFDSLVFVTGPTNGTEIRTTIQGRLEAITIEQS